MLHCTWLISWQEASGHLLPNTITHNNMHSAGSQTLMVSNALLVFICVLFVDRHKNNSLH